MTDPIDLSSEDAAACLGDLPDWHYLLNEIYWVYRHSSSGGSAPIRTHHRVVRSRLRRTMDKDPEIRLLKPETKPVCMHLSRAIDNGKQSPMGPVVRCLEKIAPFLTWRFGYSAMPGKLHLKYAFAEFLGPNGPVMASDLILGCVLFAPKATYPTHAHDGITESYIILSGAMSQNNVAVYPPGALILNTPNHSHKITSCALEPTLVSYAWVGKAQDLATNEMVFQRSATSGPNSDKAG